MICHDCKTTSSTLKGLKMIECKVCGDHTHTLLIYNSNICFMCSSSTNTCRCCGKYIDKGDI